ncbi:MAG: MFS transporter, partial [Oxalobacteraceae bacterium]
ADRWHRPRLLASGIAVWSLLTMAVAFAHTFPQLFVCRMGVGLGEAILLPTSYSLLSDLYTSNKRTRAVAIMALGVPIGSGMALLGGSRLAAWLENSGVATAIDMAPWRLVFALIGVVGLIVAATALFLPEPRRSADVASQESPVPEHLFLSVIWRSRRTLGPLVAAATAFNMAAAGFLAWMVALLVRNNGLGTATVGSVLGLSTIAIGLAAAPLAAFWTGRVGANARRGAPRTVLALCAILAGLGVVATSFAGNPMTGFFAAATALLFIFIATTVLPLAIMDSAEPAYLAKSSAVLVFFASVFGTALGPLAVGSLSDFVFGGGQGLRYAVGMGCGVLLAISALLFNVKDIR